MDRMRRSIALVLGCCIAGLPGSVLAQGPSRTTPWAQSWRSAAPPRPRLVPSADTLPHIQPTHWKKGLVIGAAIGGVVGGVFSNAVCQTSDVIDSCTGLTVGGALLMGALTGTIGALIGGAFPKRE